MSPNDGQLLHTQGLPCPTTLYEFKAPLTALVGLPSCMAVVELERIDEQKGEGIFRRRVWCVLRLQSGAELHCFRVTRQTSTTTRLSTYAFTLRNGRGAALHIMYNAK